MSKQIVSAIWENILDAVATSQSDDEVQEQLAAYEQILASPRRMRRVARGIAFAMVDAVAVRQRRSAPSLDVTLSHDVHNRAAQGILNAALKSARGLSAAARRDLTDALGAADTGEAILAFVDRYRLQVARLLSTTQLAALLEGAREVAAKVPPLGEVPVEGLPLVEQERLAALASTPAAPTPPLLTPPRPAAGSPEEVHFDVIEEATRTLAERRVVDRASYDAMDAAARAKALTVANVSADETLRKIRDSLAENVREGADFETWKGKVLQDVDRDTFLSDAHQEVVFRTNVQSAFSDGQAAVLQHPLVRSGFPYSAYDAIHDARVRENHLALESCGIGGTNVYRTADPVFQLFRPPWDYNDRCGWTPITVRQAAERGVAEAREWLRTGVEPSPPAHVAMPPFAPPAGFQRAVEAAPLSIQLSMQPMASFSHDVTEQRRGDDGRWSRGGSTKLKPPLRLPMTRQQIDAARAARDKRANTPIPRSVQLPETLYFSVPEDVASVALASGHTGATKGLLGHGENRTDSVYMATERNITDHYVAMYEGAKVLQVDTSSLDRDKFYYDAFEPPGDYDDEHPGYVAYRGEVPAHAMSEYVPPASFATDTRDVSNQRRGSDGRWTRADGSSKAGSKLARYVFGDDVQRTASLYPDDEDLPQEILGTTDHATPTQKAALLRYTDESYTPINLGLRGLIPLEDRNKTDAEEISAAFAGAPVLPHPITVWRALGFSDEARDEFVAKVEEAIDTGGEVEMLGFVSSSLNPERTDNFGGSVVLELQSRHGMYVAPTASYVPGEREWLMNHGCMWRPTGIREVKFGSTGRKVKVIQMEQTTPGGGIEGTGLPSVKLSADTSKPDRFVATDPSAFVFHPATPRTASHLEAVKNQMIAEILVAMFGDSKQARQAARGIARRRAIEQDDANAQLSITLAIPKVTKRYGRRPGPTWTSGGISANGKQIWLHPQHHAATPHAPTPAPAPTPPPAPTPAPTPTTASSSMPTPTMTYQQWVNAGRPMMGTPPTPPAPTPPPTPVPAPTPPAPAPIPAGASGGVKARAQSIAAGTAALAKLNSGQPLTATDKQSLSTKLTNMPVGMLRQLHTALGGTAVGLSSKNTVTAVRGILTGSAPTPVPATPPAPAPAPAPAPTPVAAPAPVPHAAPPSPVGTTPPPPLPSGPGSLNKVSTQAMDPGGVLVPFIHQELSAVQRGVTTKSGFKSFISIAEARTACQVLGVNVPPGTNVHDELWDALAPAPATVPTSAAPAAPAATTPASTSAPAPTAAIQALSATLQDSAARIRAVALAVHDGLMTQAQGDTEVNREMARVLSGPHLAKQTSDLNRLMSALGTSASNSASTITAAIAAQDPGQGSQAVSPPGPPPRAGLVWDATSHRWTRPVGAPAPTPAPTPAPVSSAAPATSGPFTRAQIQSLVGDPHVASQLVNAAQFGWNGSQLLGTVTTSEMRQAMLDLGGTIPAYPTGLTGAQQALVLAGALLSHLQSGPNPAPAPATSAPTPTPTVPGSLNGANTVTLDPNGLIRPFIHSELSQVQRGAVSKATFPRFVATTDAARACQVLGVFVPPGTSPHDALWDALAPAPAPTTTPVPAPSTLGATTPVGSLARPTKPTGQAPIGQGPGGTSGFCYLASAPTRDYTGKNGRQVDPTWSGMDQPGVAPKYGAVITRQDPVTGNIQVLLAKPKGYFGGTSWTWAKGGQDAGEDAQGTATREAFEEVGAQGDVIGHLTGTYTENSKSGLNAFFIMRQTGTIDDAAWQANGETADVQWIDIDQAHTLIDETAHQISDPNGNKSPNLTNWDRDMQVLEQAREALIPGYKAKPVRRVDVIPPNLQAQAAKIRSAALALKDGLISQAEADTEVNAVIAAVTAGASPIAGKSRLDLVARAMKAGGGSRAEFLSAVANEDPGQGNQAPSPPGPPPRPGLVWNATTHRWTRPAPPPPPAPVAPPVVVPVPFRAGTTSPDFVPKTGPIGKGDYEDLDYLVGTELAKMGLTAQQGLSQGASYTIRNTLRSRFDSSVGSYEVERTLRHLWAQETAVPIPAQFDHFGTGRKKNMALPAASRPVLTPDEVVAAQKWTSSGYIPWARSLRNTGAPPPQFAKEDADLQSAFGKAKVFATPVPVERHLNLDPAKLAHFVAAAQASLSNGTPVTYSGYQATSTTAVPSNFHGNVEMRINAVHGLDMGPHHHHPHVRELLLNHNTELKVTGVTQDPSTGRWIIHYDQVAPATTAKGRKSKAKAAPPAYVPPPTKDFDTSNIWASTAVQDFIAGRIPMTNMLGTPGTGGGSGTEYTLFNAIMTEAGRNARPQVLDQAGITGLKRSGWTIGFRGVTSATYNNKFRSDPVYLEAGTGMRVYGQGTYYASGSGEAADKRTAKGYGSSVIRMALPPNLRTIKQSTLQGMQRTAKNQNDSDLTNGVITSAEHRKRDEVIADLGLFAALHNYDAIDAQTSDYWVLLNRSKIAVEDKNS